MFGKLVLALTFIALVIFLGVKDFTDVTTVQKKYSNPGTHVTGVCGISSENSVGIGSQQSSQDSEYIGLSDGTLALDVVNRNPKQYVGEKCDAAQKFARCLQSSDSADSAYCTDAENLLTQESNYISDDAEALIYRQNVRLFEQLVDPFTVIVGISLSEANIVSSRYLLQGAYVAQEEYNRTHASSKLRLLIANFGATDDSAISVMRQITKALTANNNRIVGIINIPNIASLSSQFHSMVQHLVSFNVPVIFPSGSVDSPNESYSTQFHIAPAAWQEGADGAFLAQTYLPTSRVLTFVDPENSYSRNLACSFLVRLKQERDSSGPCDVQALYDACDYNNRSCTYYSSDDMGDLQQSLVPLLKTQPDILYFAGDVLHVNMLLHQLQMPPLNPLFQQLPNLRIMGGDVLYQPGAYQDSDYRHLAFTAYAFPDEWPIVANLNHTQPFEVPFSHEYALDFQGPHPDSVYGFIRPDSTSVLSYDATRVLDQSVSQVSLDGTKPDFTLDDVLHSIRTTIFQGVSGVIQFDASGNLVHKATVLLVVRQDNGRTEMKGIRGCFRPLADFCF